MNVPEGVLASAPPATPDSTIPDLAGKLVVRTDTVMPAPPPPALPESILWDQLNRTNVSVNSQDYDTAYDMYDIYVADDFENLQAWSINQITIRGSISNPDLHNASLLHWYIFFDNNGEPNGLPGDGSQFWSISLLPTDPQVTLGGTDPQDVVLHLNTPLHLPPGTWWVSFFPSLAYDPINPLDRFFWAQTDKPTWRQPGKLNNPGGGFGFPPGWQMAVNNADFTFRLEGLAGEPVVLSQIENWDPTRLHLLDWMSDAGQVIIDPSGQLIWTAEILPLDRITLIKWFHVEPCDWTETGLMEELWLNQVQVEQRPVFVDKIQPVLWIEEMHQPPVVAGLPAQFTLFYGNEGGYENDVMIRNDFPPEAPFQSANPPPDRVGPAGSWVEWDVGDLPMSARGHIDVSVLIQPGLPVSTTIEVWDGIFDHTGQLVDTVIIGFHVVPSPLVWDKTINGVPWEPGMQVTVQTSDTIVVQEVLHLNPPPILAGSMPFVPVSVEGGGSNPSLTASSPAHPLVEAEAPKSPDAVLWDQPLSTVNQAAYVDQVFPDVPTFSSFLADDFVNTQSWSIETIYIPGDGWNGFTTLMNATALTWQIYADNGGIPAGDPSGGGSPPVWTLTLTPTDLQVFLSSGTPGGFLSNTTLHLATPLYLPPGHWWLVFYPTMSFGSYGQYGRQPADTTNGYVGQAINPGGGFGVGTAWLSWMMWPRSDRPDIAFRLEGFPSEPVIYTQTEYWNPENLRWWSAIYTGDVYYDPSGVFVWTGPIYPNETLVLTKWFHVEPSTWTQTILMEELTYNQYPMEQRPVVINKLPPELWIDAQHNPPVYAGREANFRLLYGNTGGYENNVMVRNNFPPEAPFAYSNPAPNRIGPAGLWAEWDVDDLPMNAQGSIDVTVLIQPGVPPSTTITIWDGIFDHTSVLRDEVFINFHVEPTLLWDKTINGIPWEPGIQVTVQTSDTIMVQEVLHLLPLPVSMTFAPVNIEGGGSNPSLTTSSPARPLGTPEQPQDIEAVLWDQPLSMVNQYAYVDQDFPDIPNYTSFLADDFYNAQPWNIESIFIPGDGWNGFTTLMNATALTWQIYADNAGVPAGDPSGGGSPPVWTLTLPPGDPHVVLSNGTSGYPSNTTVMLPVPFSLPSGHWWVVFYPTMNFNSYGQFGRQPADTTNGYVGQFINPGGGFGLGTTWQNWTVLDPNLPHDIAFRLEGSIGQPQVYSQVETWDPTRLHLIDWAASSGYVYIDPGGQLVWTDEVMTPDTITLTKWFHVEPSTWTQTTLMEELWLNQTELELRPVIINKLPPELWIDAQHYPPVHAGREANFTLMYGNTGGFENGVMVRNIFPPEAPFAYSNPAPSDIDPGGLWAEWDVGDLPIGVQSSIDVTVLIQPGLPPSTTITIWDGIFDHTGVLRDEVIFEFHVEPTILWDKFINGVPWEPGIQVTVQTSDTIMVQEVLHLLPLPASMTFVPVNVEGGGGNPSLTTSSPARPLGTPEQPQNIEAVLWDQPLSLVNQTAYVDQDFPDIPNYTSFLADDFYNAQPWNIETIFIPGDGWNGFTTLMNATALTWQIYADNAGVPAGDPSGGGSPPVWTLTLPPGDPHVVLSNGTSGYPSNTTVMLPVPFTLPPGHWWLVFYPTMNRVGGGQYGRQPADTTNGYVGQFINPGGGFGFGTIWQNWTVISQFLPHDIAFRLEGSVGQPQVYSQVETWDPTHLHLLDWAATGGNVIIDPTGQLVWTSEIMASDTITLTKWYHVEPCTWTQTTLMEELWLNQTELEQRPVIINKLTSQLWIDASFNSLVAPGEPAAFTLTYGNLGGYENAVMIRNEFPPEAPFSSAIPAPNRVGPAGSWAEWDIGDLPMGAQGVIDVVVQIQAGLPPGSNIQIYDGIYDHTGVLRDWISFTFHVPSVNLGVVKSAPARVFANQTFAYDLTVTNYGPEDATNVQVVDFLPAGVGFVSASPGCAVMAGTVTCTASSLDVGDSISFTIIVNAPNAEVAIVNHVQVSASELDPDTSNNVDEVLTNVVWHRFFMPVIINSP